MTVQESQGSLDAPTINLFADLMYLYSILTNSLIIHFLHLQYSSEEYLEYSLQLLKSIAMLLHVLNIVFTLPQFFISE